MSDFEHKAELACRLIERASFVVAQTADSLRKCDYIDDEHRLGRGMQYLDSLTEFVGEKAPDFDWWRDYFSLTGEHMVLTEEGWEPAEAFDDNDGDIEILDEVNKPEVVNEPA